MALALDQLVFSVDSTQLDEARIKIAKLGDAVAALNKPLQEMSRSSAKTNEVIAKSELAAEKARTATKALTDTTGQVKDKVDPLAKLIEKLSNNYTDMASGFTKGESSILNQARNLGIFGSELQPVIALLEKIKTLNKDPFDASLGGVRSITQEFEKLQQRANLAAQGIMLTTKQLGEYSKLAAEAAGKVEGMGFDPKSGEGLNKYNQLLAESQNKYLEIVGAVNKLTQAEKDRNEALKQQERLLASNKAISDAMIREVAGQVGQKSPELQQMAEFYKKQEIAARQLTAAEDDLILREQKLAFVNKELAAGLSTASANALFKYQKDLEALGKSADEVSQRMSSFRAGLVERQSHSPMAKLTQDVENTSKRLDHLSRALGPQITDIFVGLATGQSLLTVALQQGGQIRDQIALSGVASANMGKALSTAAVQMVGSLKDVSVAMGTLLITPFIAGGKAVTDFATKILFANKTIQSYSLAIAMYADNGNKLASGLVSAMSKIPMLIGASFAAVTLAVTTLTVAFFVAQKELDNLSKQLILKGGSLGLNKDLALDYAKSLDGVSGSTSQVITVIQAMAKEGRFLREEISLVTKSAVDLEKYAGVSIEDTVKSFAKLKEEPVKALLELAKQTGMVSAETLNMVVALEKQGNTSQAASVAIKALADVNNEQVERMKRDYSSLGLMLIDVGDWFANLWRQAKGVVYEPTAMEQAVKALQQADVALTEAQKSLNSSENLSVRPSTQAIDVLRQRLDARKNEYVQLIKNQQAENQSRINNVAIADAKKRSLDLEASSMSPIEKAKANITKYTTEIAKAEQLVASTKDEQIIKDTLISNLKKSIAKENENIAKENKKNNADQLSEAKKIENFGKKALEESRKYIAGERAEVEQTTESWKRYLKLEESDFWTKIPESLRSQIRLNYQLADAEERMREQRTKSQEEFMKNFGEIARLNSETYRKNTVSIQQAKEEAESIKYQASLIGLSSDEREKLLALKKIDLQTEKDINDLISKGIPLNATVIQQTRDLGQLQKDNVQAMLDLKQYEKLMSELGDVMFLALTNRGAQAGKKLRDLIKAELMKPITLVINAVIGDILGSLGIGLGNSGTLGAVNTGSSLVNIYNTVSAGFAGLASSVGGMISSVGSATGLTSLSSFGAGMKGATLAPGLAGPTTAGASGAVGAGASVGSAIATYAPYALAAVVALDQLGILDRWSGDPDAFLVQQATGVNQQFASSTQSRLGTVGFVNGSATIMRNGRLVSEYGETEGITTSAQRAALDVITALDNAVADTLSQSQIVEISKNLSGWFQKSWSVESGTIENFIASRYETILGTLDSSFGKLKDYQKEGEKLSDTAVRLITTFTTVKTVFENIGVSIDGLTYKAANDFATVFGGVDKLGSSLSKFYDTFYTEAEKTVNLAKNTTEAFNALGLALPSSRDAFKELVKSSINAGNPQLLASLLSLQDAFVLLTESAEAASEEVASESIMDAYVRLKYAATTTEDIAKQRIDIEQRLFEATATQVEIQAKARSEIDSYNLGIYDSMIAAEEAKVAQQKLAEEKLAFDQKIAEEMLAAEKVVLEQRSALQDRLFQATATQSEIQAKARSEINDSNKALYDQVLAAEEASNASKQLADTMQQLADSIINEVNRLKGAILGDVGVSGGVSGLTSEFATLTAQARAGDMKAVEKLPEYSQAIEQAVASTAANASDVVYARAWLAASLGNTADVISGTDTSMQPTALTSLAASTVTNGASVISTSATSQSELIAVLVAEIQGLRAEVRADVSANTKTSKILERANQDGESLSVTVI